MFSTDSETTFLAEAGQLLEGMSLTEQETLLSNMGRRDLMVLKQHLMLENPAAWIPLAGPQKEASYSPADIVLFGGAAGGGKTDLGIGLALAQHRRTLFIRREGLQLLPVKDRMEELLGSRNGLNSQNGVWTIPANDSFPYDRQIQFGGVPNPGDERKFQGNARDLLVLDEAANLLEAQVRFLLNWVRTTVPGQRCRTLMCSNPPTTAEGRWIVEFFAPWLDHLHPKPAQPGELRWYATIDGKDYECDDNKPFILDAQGNRSYDFDKATPITEVIQPLSRTFIPSRIADNPFLVHTGYVRQLQAAPEPLRSQMLYGDFRAGMKDDAWQLIPTGWVQAAMDRWSEREDPGEMTSMGVDVSRGGADEAVIACRHRDWYAPLEVFPGSEVPDGPLLGSHVLRLRRNLSPIHVDVVGVGSSVYDYLVGQGVQTVGISGAEASSGRDRSNTHKFRNMRTAIYWRLRELLEPQFNPTLKLPPDPQLKADLCAPRWKILEGNVVAVETKDEIIKRLGRSPDKGDAVVYAAVDTPLQSTQKMDFSQLHRSKLSPMQRAMKGIR